MLRQHVHAKIIRRVAPDGMDMIRVVATLSTLSLSWLRCSSRRPEARARPVPFHLPPCPARLFLPTIHVLVLVHLRPSDPFSPPPSHLAYLKNNGLSLGLPGSGFR